MLSQNSSEKNHVEGTARPFNIFDTTMKYKMYTPQRRVEMKMLR